MNNIESLLIKPAGPDCNLNCTYCFYLDKAEMYGQDCRHIMNEEVLAEMYRQISKMPSQNLSLTFQGGEPSLAGIDFYKKAMELQRTLTPNKLISNSFQTNGILIDESWAAFLAKNNFLVGLSIDGPPHIHNHYRKNKNGEGSFDRVMKGYIHLMNHHVETNAMCCLTDYSAGYPDELYNFYKSLNLNWMQFIPVFEKDKNNSDQIADFSVKPRKYADFLIQVFKRWISDFHNGSPTTHIKYFESLFFTYLNLSPPDCTMNRNCGVYLVIEHNGDVFSCDFFVESNRKLGNIVQDNMIDLFNSKKHNDFGKIKSQLPIKCTQCKYFKHCMGGCTKDRLNNIQNPDYPGFCEATLLFLKFSEPYFEQLAKQWRINYAADQNIKFDPDTYDAEDHFKKL